MILPQGKNKDSSQGLPALLFQLCAFLITLGVLIHYIYYTIDNFSIMSETISINTLIGFHSDQYPPDALMRMKEEFHYVRDHQQLFMQLTAIGYASIFSLIIYPLLLHIQQLSSRGETVTKAVAFIHWVLTCTYCVYLSLYIHGNITCLVD